MVSMDCRQHMKLHVTFSDLQPRRARTLADEKEFPVVLLQWAEDDSSDSETAVRKRSLVTVDTFHSYVRPTWRPQLSEFCINLTGIQQVRSSSTACLMYSAKLTTGNGRLVPDLPGSARQV